MKKLPNPTINKKTDNVYQETGTELKPRVPLTPPPPDKSILKSQEQTTSISTDQCKNSSLLNSANSTKLLLISDEPSADTQAQSSKLKKTPSYEEVRRAQETKQREDKKGSPMYDDVLTTLEVSVHLQKKAACSPEEHRYHVLCDPNEEQRTKDILTSHHYENKDIKKVEESSPVVHTPQRRKHEYEEITDVSTEGKPERTDPDSPQDRYNVLSNQLDMAPFQSGIVQEDPAESPIEDKYYSTARVHRLVPVGKPIGSLTSDHLYQALDERDPRKRRRPGSKDYEHVQTRHNTFTTTSCASPACPRSNENLMRTYSSTAQSLEKLDPMYDEPYKPQQRSGSLTRVDIYNADSLFDDPKYGTKSSTAGKVFDDPTYASRTAAVQQDSQTGSQATERHVSFSVETKTGVGEESLEKSGAKQAVVRKTIK